MTLAIKDFYKAPRQPKETPLSVDLVSSFVENFVSKYQWNKAISFQKMNYSIRIFVLEIKGHFRDLIFGFSKKS